MTGDGYLLYHSIGQYPGKTADLAVAMAGFASVWGRADDGQWPELLGGRARYLARWATILGAPDDTVTHVENVTQGLHALVTALPPDWLRGKRVLIAADCFPSNHFLLTALAGRMGFTLDTVPARQGSPWVEPEDVADRWGPDVGLALLTWVSSTSSHRIDLAPLLAQGRAMGTITGVDVTQAAGLLPYDATALGADFTISTSLKWMCGTPGAGVLHVARNLIADCQPVLRGWFSQDDPFRWDLDAFAYAPDIRRFDTGTPGIVAALASLPALDWHAVQDHAAILAHNRALSAQLIEGADALGLPLVSPRDEARRGGSVMLRLPDADAARAAVARLRDAQVHADHRGAVLRLSPGVVTTAAGVERALATLRGA